MLKFKFLTGDIDWREYGGKFISKKLNNGEFDYWLVMEVVNMHEATGDEDQDKYYVNLQAVSPESVDKENLDRAIESFGMPDIVLTDTMLVETLSDYGIYAVLWQGTNNNINSLMREARRQANLSSMLFGFYMDRRQNRIGQTGWDLIRGQDVREFLNI